MAKKYKHSLQDIKEVLSREGYRLLSTCYKGARSKLDALCPNGHKHRFAWYTFQQGQRCSMCFGNRKMTIEQIALSFQQRGYRLLSTQYDNAHSKLDFECPEGHRHQMTWGKFKQGHGCVHCSHRRPVTIEQVRSAFEKEGYRLMSYKYVNCCSKLHYICPNGHKNKTAWNEFRSGHRCPECIEWRGERQLGEILERLFPGEVRSQDNLGFLKQQKVDFSVRRLRLAFEYDGIQHFEPTTFGGMSRQKAVQCFVKQQRRDERKNQLCRDNGISLVRIAHTDTICEEVVEERIKRRRIENAEK